MADQHPIPRACLTAGDLDGERRIREPGCNPLLDRTVYLATRSGATTDGPGAVERADRLAQAEALRSIDWGADDPRETEADRAAAQEVEELQARLADFNRWPDGAHCASDLPADYGLRDGPAEGHPLRRRPLQPLALLLIGVAIGACVLALAWPWVAPLVRGWIGPEEAAPLGRLLT